MFKKTLLSMAVASAVVLSGCGGSNPDNAGATTQITNPIVDATEGRVYPLFNPVTGKLPLPNDLIFDSVAKDGTFRVADTVPPVTTALNELSGASTSAPIDVAFNGTIDASTVNGEVWLKDSNGNLVLNGDKPVPNPLQNVFLLPLKYASGDPVQGLSNQEPPTIDTAALASLSYTVGVTEQSGHSVIRIYPKKPLEPKVRYVVVVTNEVKDINGQPIVRDPALTNLIDESLALPSASLAPVRSLVNKLWLSLAEGYFAAATNLARSSQSLSALSRDNVALTFSFTTSGDEKVLEYIANPTEWAKDLYTTATKVQIAAAAVQGGATTYDQVVSAIGNFPDDSTKAALNLQFHAIALNTTVDNLTAEQKANVPDYYASSCPDNDNNGVLKGEGGINCVANLVAGTVQSKLGSEFPTPKARTVDLSEAEHLPALAHSAVLASLIDNQGTPDDNSDDKSYGLEARVVEGTIELPYYLGIPQEGSTDGSVINSTSWTADSDLATKLSQLLGSTLPQSNPDLTKVVNYIFPFPKQTDADPSAEGVNDRKVPLLVIYPESGSGPWPVVVYQHGITTDRSAALTMGSILASKGFVVVAIDMPLHGVDAFTQETQDELAATLLVQGRVVTQSDVDNNTTAYQQTLAAIKAKQFAIGVMKQIYDDFACTSVDPTSSKTDAQTAKIEILVDKTCGQAAFEQVAAAFGLENAVNNAGSVIPGLAHTDYERHFDFTADASLNPVPMDYANGVGSSGSLFINLQGFTNSRDKLRQAQLDLLNLFQSLKTLDVNGDGQDDVDESRVFFAGHSLGTVAGSAAVAVANSTPVQDIQAAVMLAPASGITKMLENSPGFSPTILGGLAAAGLQQGDENLETFFRIIQATIDAADPINWADNLKNAGKGVMAVNIVGTEDENGNTKYKSDQTNVIEAAKTLLNPNAPTSRDYLAGALPFSEQLGAKLVTDSSVTADGTPDILALNLGYGAHGTFVLPDPTADADELARQTAAFGETLTQMVEYFKANGELTAPVDPNGGRTEALGGTVPAEPIIIDKPMDELKQLN